MTNLIKADLLRISKKWILYVFMLLPLAAVLYGLRDFKQEDSFEYLNSLSRYYSLYGALFFSLSAMIGVFGDELHTNAMQTAIGRGLSRTKLIIAKFLDCVILLLLQFTLLTAFIFLTNAAEKVIASGEDNLTIVITAVLCGFIPACSYVAISGLLIFLMWNAGVGFISVLFLSTLTPVLLELLKTLFKINLTEVWIRNLMSDSLNSFSMGEFNIAFLPAILIYVVLPVGLTALIFRRKELEL